MIRSRFTCRIAKHASYLLEKEIMARAFSRRFTIARWKKTNFPGDMRE